MPGDNRVSFEKDIRARFRQGTASTQDLEALWWWLKFLCLPYSFRTYQYLFPDRPDLSCGDITPNYYFLKAELIERLSQHNPGARIVLVLRRPVERVWSYTRMSISDSCHKPFERISHAEFTRYFDQLHSWWRPYLASIRIWEAHFPRVHVGYYDTLCENPLKFYRQICGFLQIDSSYLPANLERAINKGRSDVLPPELRKYLSAQYINEVRELAEWGNSPYPRMWLRQMERDRIL